MTDDTGRFDVPASSVLLVRTQGQDAEFDRILANTAARRRAGDGS
jgi:hypothetical protein